MNPSLQDNLLTERENTKRIERLERIPQARGIESMSLDRTLAVISDPEVVEPKFLRGERHLSAEG